MPILIAILATAIVIHAGYYLGYRYRAYAQAEKARADQAVVDLNALRQTANRARLLQIALARHIKRTGHFTISKGVIETSQEHQLRAEPLPNGGLKITVSPIGK